jgi:hypothetical protein
MSKHRVLFFGYSEAGLACLDLLLSRGDNVIALIKYDPRQKVSL